MITLGVEKNFHALFHGIKLRLGPILDSADALGNDDDDNT